MKHQIMDSFSKLSFTKMENQASHTFNWLDIISFIENHQVKKKKKLVTENLIKVDIGNWELG